MGTALAGDDRDQLEHYLRLSETIPGWTRGCEARDLWRVSYSLPFGATIVEIGSFLGSGTIVLAGACRTRGSGLVNCIDPFDGRGDSFSVPYYERILAELGGGSLRTHFERNIRECGVAPWVRMHSGPAEHIAGSWSAPIDLIFFDGDQSPVGARKAYDAWVPFLKVGGVIALHNSDPANRRPDHDGQRLIVEQEIRQPAFREVRLVTSTTFAMKAR